MSVFFRFEVKQVGDGPSEAQQQRMDDLLTTLRVEAIENESGRKPAPTKKPEPPKKPGKPTQPEKQKQAARTR